MLQRPEDPLWHSELTSKTTWGEASVHGTCVYIYNSLMRNTAERLDLKIKVGEVIMPCVYRFIFFP